MIQYAREEDTIENWRRVRIATAALASEHAFHVAILSFYLFMATLIVCIACLLLGWPSWVSVFVKDYWGIISIAILVISIGFAKRSINLRKLSDQGKGADPHLYTYVNEYQTLEEIIAYEAYVADRRNFPGQLVAIFVSGAIFGAIFFGGLFS